MSSTSVKKALNMDEVWKEEEERREGRMEEEDFTATYGPYSSKGRAIFRGIVADNVEKLLHLEASDRPWTTKVSGKEMEREYPPSTFPFSLHNFFSTD